MYNSKKSLFYNLIYLKPLSMSKLEKSILDFKSLGFENKIKVCNVDYSIAESYLPMLEMLDSLNTSIIIVIDYFKKNYFFTSKNINSRLGFNADRFPYHDQYWFRSRFHPEDYIATEGSVLASLYHRENPSENPKHTKLTSDFRILNDYNNWVRLISQTSILEVDVVGNIWLTLLIMDFSPIQDMDTPGRVTFRNVHKNEIIFSIEGKMHSNLNITERERQILDMLAKGLRSKEISEQLFISVNTVNNHRSNIMNKLNVSNSVEAVGMAKSLGLV